jgi:hypothetical protein
MDKLNIPFPIIFGPQAPQLRIRLERGTQYLYSLTNSNLYVHESDLTPQGNFPISSLFSYQYTSRFVDAPKFIESKGLTVPCCSFEFCDIVCPMLFKDYDELQIDPQQPELKLKRLHMHSTPQLHKCKVLSPLLKSLTTPAETRFAETYYKWAICAEAIDYHTPERVCNTLSRRYGDFLRAWQERQLRYETSWPKTPESVTLSIVESLTTPALLPQVWLNYTYNPHPLPSGEKDDLQHMPKRVDFVFIQGNKIHIVEVDDPSHYAKFDNFKRIYQVDEETYTNNLIAERNFRQQGFEICRLSNFEILNSSESQLLQLIWEALGIPPNFPPSGPELPHDTPF